MFTFSMARNNRLDYLKTQRTLLESNYNMKLDKLHRELSTYQNLLADTSGFYNIDVSSPYYQSILSKENKLAAQVETDLGTSYRMDLHQLDSESDKWWEDLVSTGEKFIIGQAFDKMMASNNPLGQGLSNNNKQSVDSNV